jgi:hypothetical protein
MGIIFNIDASKWCVHLETPYDVVSVACAIRKNSSSGEAIIHHAFVIGSFIATTDCASQCPAETSFTKHTLLSVPENIIKLALAALMSFLRL